MEWKAIFIMKNERYQKNGTEYFKNGMQSTILIPCLIFSFMKPVPWNDGADQLADL